MTRIRFRTDSSFAADDAARVLRGHNAMWFDNDELKDVEPAQPGDCWRVRWARTVDMPEGAEGAIAGYAICCPKCKQVHNWTSARNCPRVDGVCKHSGLGSCWTWTGSAEEGTLTASPSLHSLDDDNDGGAADNGTGCGWHGYLRNGELVEA